MPRRSNSILDDLVTLPWWINVILAIIVYLSLKFWIPTFEFQSPAFRGFALAVPVFAPILTGILLFIAAISAFNAWKRGELLERQKGIETLRAINWREFEELVGEAYRRKGYAVTDTGGGGADGGIDHILRKGHEKVLVQCKHWKLDKVGVKVIRELYGVVNAEGATGGIVISSGTFTHEARDFARGKPIKLIDGSELMNIVLAVQKSSIPIRKKSIGNICPLCGAEMVLRTAKKGMNPGKKFWGCSDFPKCRATKSYNT